MTLHDPRHSKTFHSMNQFSSILHKYSSISSLLGATLGVIGACAFAPVGIWFCVFISLAGLFVVITASKDWKWAAVAAWLWGVGYFGVGLSWTYHSMAVYGGLPSIVAGLGVLALAGVLATVPAMVALIAKRLPVSDVVRVACVLPALWTLGELVRGVWVMSFGWLSIGYALIDTLFASWAPILGVYGVGFLALWMTGLVVALLMPQTKTVVGTRATLSLVVGAIALSSIAVSDIQWSTPGKTLEVRIVQPDLPVVFSGKREIADARLERVEAMSTRSAMGSRLDLIVWPEGIYPWPLQRHSRTQVEAPLRVTQSTGATVLFNAFDEPERKTYFNSVWTATPDGKLQAIYAKHHLVPFGEYVPSGFRWFVDLMQIPMNDQASGELPKGPIEIAETPTALQICYEVMFGEELQSSWQLGNPQLLINTSNLVWFGSAVGEQFTQMTRMRAKEFARPAIQSMNNAMSAVVSPTGEIDRLAGKGAQTLDARLQTAQGVPTPFVKFGHWMTVLGALILLMFGCISLMFGCISLFKSTAVQNNWYTQD